VRFVREQALPWFAAFATPDALLDRADSPLTDKARQGLREAVTIGGDPGAIARSRKLLGIRN